MAMTITTTTTIIIIIARGRGAAGAGGAELGDEGLARGVVDIADDEVRAVRGPAAREGGAQAGGPSRHQDGLASQGGGVVWLGEVDRGRLADGLDEAVLVWGRQGGHARKGRLVAVQKKGKRKWRVRAVRRVSERQK
ncbi:hypothetical protein VP1G_10800 [Cytospora mali]|uniref:Uncharacterized protein n=1 Tax=Cytospora mali TaxID=578113 RepID=A0A194UWC1_CYTMA|nr:hypothetical protein VP1G_10800 [Valsa mali var. pyri (nom. inval.)]